MKKIALSVVAVLVLIILFLSPVHAQRESELRAFHADTKDGLKSELLYWDKEKAYNGYTLFTPRMSADSVKKLYLINMAGSVVNSWDVGNATNPKLMDDGHILYGFTEIDWDGNQVFRAGGAHHDTCKIYNKKLKEYTYIGLTREQSYTQENVIAAGGDPSRDYTDAYCDGVLEVDKNGNEIWRWRFLDHVIQARDPKAPNYVAKGKTIADYPGKLDLDWVTDQSRVNGDGTPGVINDWQHTNALDYNEKLDHIAINAKHWSEFYIVDHGATFVPNDPEKSIELAAGDAGDFIYRFGNPSAYKQGKPSGDKDEGDYQMYGCHNIEWIDDGLPGAGNMTIYDNGCYNPMGRMSSVLEINPFLDANGKNTGWYVNPPDAGYDRNNISKQIAWSFESYKGKTFYSHNVSNAQRLPNGNTFVCAGRPSHLFEVTPDGEVVWEYINPLGNQGLLTVLPTSYNNTNSVFRAYRHGVDHPAFKGKNLKPRGTLSEIYAGVEIEPVAPKRRGKKGGGKKGKGK
jgi:hypothetical protein